MVLMSKGRESLVSNQNDSTFYVTTSIILELQESAMAHLVDNYWEICLKMSYWF